MGSLEPNMIEPNGTTDTHSIDRSPNSTFSTSKATNDLDTSVNTHANGHNVNRNIQLGPKSNLQAVAEPIAIIGMAMRLPGGIRDSESFWDFLVNKRSARCRVPKDRYNIDAFYGPGKLGHVGTEHGYFLEDVDLAALDASFWSMTKQEAEIMDPSQRLILEIVYECLENAGAKNWRGQNVGCYLGSFGEDWLDMDLKDGQNMHMYRMAGYSDFALANRVSYEFGFQGPSMTMRTACSSSLTGLHEACMSLARGDCVSAIVGGTSIIIAPRMTIALTEQGVISPTGSCKTFDADADGYARGEAVSALYIKKLSDAIRDGDPIRAVIRSTCVNSDGKTPGLTMPSTESHEALIRQGHHLAGIADFSKTAMIECHGTGTKIGDPIETTAVANIFGDHGIYIGSVKPNLGHSEGASGISSVIKMVLALEKKTIPPNILFKTPNPKIPFKQCKLVVPVEPMPWPADRLERVAVNSFGIGGANAHVVLESAASLGLGKPITEMAADNIRPKLLIFSAKHPEALRRSVEDHKSYLSAHPNALNDISYSLCTRREALSHRAFSVVSSADDFELSSVTKLGDTPNLVFTFTGQGAQWAQMGKELIEKQPTYKNSIRALDHFLSFLPIPPKWKLEDEILASKHKSRLSEAEYSQPCCTAIQVALVDLLTTWNIRPGAVVGHSSGEIAAAYACGSITAEAAILIAYQRGQVTKGLGKLHIGGMAAIGLGRIEVTSYLIPGVSIGCENSPGSVTLTGDVEPLESVMNDIREDFPDVLVRSLRVECAYHSYHMKAVEDKYRSLLGKSIHAQKPRIPFYSSVIGDIISGEGALSAPYWVQNLVSPVLFHSAINAILGTLPSLKTFLEIGPHSALAGPIRQIVRNNNRGVDYVPTLVRNGEGLGDLFNTAGQLWLRNIDVNFDAINPTGKLLTDLPTYPWHYDGQYWLESRLSKDWRLRKFPHHDLLGTRVVESTDMNPSWRNMLRLDNVPWIQDHEIAQDILFPGAAYVAMAGEAVRQLTNLIDYTVRRVHFTTALVLHPGKAVEVTTNLRPVRLTTSLDSQWFEFIVASLHENTWIKHCAGQVRAGSDSPVSLPQIKPLQRKVPSSIWYRVMRRFGLNYGPKFRCLTNISAHVSEKKAVAVLVEDHLDPKETTFQLHSTTIDAAFQLFFVAAFKALPRLFTKLSVPTYIEELYIQPPKGEIIIQAEAESAPGGGLSGNLVGLSEGEVVMSLKTLRLSPLDSDDSTGEDPHAAVELQWERDLNCLDAAQLMRPYKDITPSHLLVEKLALACMVETSIQLQHLESSAPHLEKFRTWLDTQRLKAVEGVYPDVPGCASIASLTSSRRNELIKDLLDQSTTTDAAAVATAIHRIFVSGIGIFLGAADPLEILLENDILTKVYDFMQLWEYSEFFKLAAHYKPNLKILEIGAGTGGTTSTILPHLESVYGERMYSSYTYTDISAGFFVGAKERFKDVQAIKYAILDISKDPMEQGFEAESFDLIVACNVLHATPVLKDTLTNVRRLLHPRGRLLLQELNPSTRWINYVMGVLSGWWLGESDGRANEPYVAPERWERELKSAGFGGINAIAYDGQLNNNIIAMPACNKHAAKRLTLLYGGLSAERSSRDEIERNLRESGYELDCCTLQQTPTPGQMIVSLLDLEAPFLHSLTAERFEAFRDFLTRIEGSAMLWITGAAQIACQDPRYSMILGIARTIRQELLIDFATLELEVFDTNNFKAIPEVLHQLEHRVQDSDMDPIFEYAYSGGHVQISKFHWISVPKQLADKSNHSFPKQLDIERPGFLQTLRWKQVQPLPTLTGDWVEVEPRAVGLNFKDVLISMGIVEGPKSLQGGGVLGCENAGVVTNIGPEVRDLAVGDRVICISSGSFATTLTTTEKLCAKMADDLSFVEGATIPCVYGTVIHSLLDLARLGKGQSVLIHSACGGVGIAAIQIAKMVGAEIFCTVGNSEKVEYLRSTFGIPRNRIFNSRDTSFLHDVMSETNGRGVDVVLNSLSGELLHSSWKCVADFGIMVEIGKRDLIGQGLLSMDLFEQNRSFMGVDLSQLCTDRPSVMNSLLRRGMEFYETGYIQPILPITVFEATKVEEAFRFMQKGQHIGKIVVTLPSTPEELIMTTKRADLSLRSDRSYLLVGGLGGLGRSVASWLVENGARHIVFFSRSAGSLSKDDPYVKELAAQGCAVQAISGSVSKMSDVESVIHSVEKPIAGVLQASMVLSDAAFPMMTFDNWQTASQPKVQGTWNLHEALKIQREPLDFFFLFSSLSGLGGQIGQANYSSANTFLDAFVQYRHSLGLPASTLDIGAMDDVGYLSQNTDILEALRATSLHVLHEQDLLDSLQLMIKRSQPHLDAKDSLLPPRTGYVCHSQVAIGVRSTLPISAPNNRTLWKKDPRMAIYRNLEFQDTTTVGPTNTDNNLKQFLRDASANPSSLETPEATAFLAKEIGTTLFGFVMRNEEDLDLTASLASLGVDSLVSIELRNWFRQKVGAEFTVLEIMGTESIGHLGVQAAEKLGVKFRARG